MNYRKRVPVCFYSALAFLLLILFPFILLLHKNSAYYAYKEMTYDIIIADICKGAKGTKNQAILINNFLYQYFSSPHDAIVKDKDIYSDLIRGIAWCDQRAWALST